MCSKTTYKLIGAHKFEFTNLVLSLRLTNLILSSSLQILFCNFSFFAS